MTNPFKFLKRIMKDNLDLSINRYSTSIEYWERIEHVKPTRTYDDEWRRKYYHS